MLIFVLFAHNGRFLDDGQLSERVLWDDTLEGCLQRLHTCGDVELVNKCTLFLVSVDLVAV